MQPVHVQWTPLHKDHHASNVKHFVSLMKSPSTVSIVSHKQFLINIVAYKYKCFFCFTFRYDGNVKDEVPVRAFQEEVCDEGFTVEVKA